jgi:hypothetical protein
MTQANYALLAAVGIGAWMMSRSKKASAASGEGMPAGSEGAQMLQAWTSTPTPAAPAKVQGLVGGRGSPGL